MRRAIAILLLITATISFVPVLYFFIFSGERRYIYPATLIQNTRSISSLNQVLVIHKEEASGPAAPTVASNQDQSIVGVYLYNEDSKTEDKQNHAKVTFKPDVVKSSSLQRQRFPESTFASDYTCKNKLCTEFFNENDKLEYKHCLRDYCYVYRLSKQEALAKVNGSCHFMNGTGRSAVALVSFPGSGNTWVRGLLERATGVCTGSIYCDTQLRRGFNGEGMTSGSLIAVKVHHSEDEPTVNWADPQKPGSPGYSAAILIVRNPFDALIAEWNRQKSRFHTGVASSKKFGTNSAWNTFVHKEVENWKKYFNLWLVNSHGHPVVMVRYEDLKSDIVTNVERMLDFLGFPYRHDEVEEKLAKDFSKFKRKHRKEFEHYTMDQKSTVKLAISQTVSFLQSNNCTFHDVSGIQEYLSTS